MLWQKTLEIIFKTLHLLGILSAEYCTKQKELIVTKRSEKHILIVTVVTLMLMEYLTIATCIAALRGNFKIYNESKTSDSLLLLQLIEGSIIHMYLSATLFLFRHKNVQILDGVLKCYRKNFGSNSSRGLRKRIVLQSILSVIWIVMFIGNIAISGIKSGSFTWFRFIGYFLILSVHFTYSTIYICCYTCLEHILNELLRNYNNKLKVKLKESIGDVVTILRERNNLLVLCSRVNMTLVYGLFILIQSAFILSNISMFVFLATVTFDWHKEKRPFSLIIVISISLYSLPPLIVYGNALWVNDVDKEANKTAKILAKFPRGNTSVDKMISKFLLKNLRQKPILTAYGFFSLDKTTLFKLFTAVFTYMVILVQFKELESTTKKLSHSSS